MKKTGDLVNAILQALLPNLGRDSLLALITGVAIATACYDSAAAQDRPFQFDLLPPAGAIANCIPNGRASVTVFPKEEKLGTDTLQLRASGLLPNIEVTVFLTELAAPPFGAVEYLGDFNTNSAGEGSFRTNTIIDEAFA